MASMILLSLLATPSFAQTLPPGEPIRDALGVQITQAGFDNIEDVAENLVPELLPADLLDIGDVEIDLGFLGSIDITGLAAQLTVDSVDLIPRNDEIVIEVLATIGVNDASNPFNMDVPGCDSPAYVAPLPVVIELAVRPTLTRPQSGGREFQVRVELATLDIALGSGSFVFLDNDFGCSILGFGVGALGDTLLGFIEPEIEAAIIELEPTIEDALNQAVFNDQIELLDAMLEVNLEPSRLEITPAGMELVFEGSLNADQAACVADLDPGGSLETESGIPTMVSLPSSTQVAAHLSDEFINQGLYAVYRGGIFCFTLDENADISLPIPLDSTLLELIGGEGYATLTGDQPQPLVIQTKPIQVPTARFDGGNDIDIEVRELQLRMFTEVEGRMAKAVGMSIDADAGAGILFDGTTGELSLDLQLGGDDIRISVLGDLLVAGTGQDIVDGIGGLVDTLIPALLGDALGGPLLTLPAFEGLGLTGLNLFPNGSERDWLTIDASVGRVDYGTEVVEGEEGCDAGCDAGCASGNPGFGGGLMVFLPVWLLRRRRAPGA